MCKKLLGSPERLEGHSRPGPGEGPRGRTAPERGSRGKCRKAQMHRARGRAGARAQILLGGSKAVLRGGARTGKAGPEGRRWEARRG